MKFPKPIFAEPLIDGPEWITTMSPVVQALLGLAMGAVLAILLGRVHHLVTNDSCRLECFERARLCLGGSDRIANECLVIPK